MQLIERVDVGTTQPRLEVSIQWQPRPADGEGTVLNLNQELAGSAAQLAALKALRPLETGRDFHSQKFALLPIFFSTGVRRTCGQTPAGACPDQRVNRHRSAKSQKAHRLRLLAATGVFVFEMSGNILLSEQP